MVARTATIPSGETWAAVAFVRRGALVLAVWNRRYGGWSLPGGKVEAGEAPGTAAARELREETGIGARRVEYAYDAPSCVPVPEGRGSQVMVFRVDAPGEPSAVEPGCPVAWLTRSEFLAKTCFRPFYEPCFAQIWPEALSGS